MEIEYLLAQASKQALLSKKPNTKVGALLLDKNQKIIIKACNDYIMPLFNDNELEPELNRGYYSEHAERNLIYSAIKSGIHDFQDKTLVVTHFPCSDCARAIILTGIKKIIVGNHHKSEAFLETWKDNLHISRKMLNYNGVKIISL